MPRGTSASKVIYFLSDSGSLWILKWLFRFDRSGRSRKKLRSSNGDALVCQPHMLSIFTAMRCYVSFPKIQSAMKFAQSSTWQIKTWQTCKVKIGAWAKLALSSLNTPTEPEKPTWNHKRTHPAALPPCLQAGQNTHDAIHSVTALQEGLHGSNRTIVIFTVDAPIQLGSEKKLNRTDQLFYNQTDPQMVW